VPERALLDTGVLVAYLHRDDQAHVKSVEALAAFRGTLLTTEPVLTESVYLMGRVRGGAEACLEFFIRGGAVLVPSSRASLVKCKALRARYANLDPDLADLTLVALGDEMRAYTVFTLDRRGFSTYRGERGKAFEVRPR
jgi:hypothetical protein